MVEGLGFMVESLGFRIWGLGFMVEGLGFMVEGLGFRIWGLSAHIHIYQHTSIFIPYPKAWKKQILVEGLGLVYGWGFRFRIRGLSAHIHIYPISESLKEKNSRSAGLCGLQLWRMYPPPHTHPPHPFSDPPPSATSPPPCLFLSTPGPVTWLTRDSYPPFISLSRLLSLSPTLALALS